MIRSSFEASCSDCTNRTLLCEYAREAESQENRTGLRVIKAGRIGCMGATGVEIDTSTGIKEQVCHADEPVSTVVNVEKETLGTTVLSKATIDVPTPQLVGLPLPGGGRYLTIDVVS